MSWTFIILETHVSLADTDGVTGPGRVSFPNSVRIHCIKNMGASPGKDPKEYESCQDVDLHRTGHCCLLPAA